MKALINIKIVAYIAILILLAVSVVHAQPQIGGPYEPDSSTVLLLHFDGDLTNDSEFSADGIGHGSLYYLPNVVSGLGQCLYIDNDSGIDSSYVMVPDTFSLDLTGDWTIEGWINIITFGENINDWRWVPRLIIKTGDEVFWRPNYFIEMWGDNRMFSCGYHTADQSAWPQVNTANNIMESGKWYHLTFIRDTSRHILLQAIHNEHREMTVFVASDYNTFKAPPDTPPITTDKPLYIGFAGGGNDSWLDGYVDEVRISNIVREIPLPPIIKNVTQMKNQLSDVTLYEVGASIFTLFETNVQRAAIHYTTGEDWKEIEMTGVTTDSFAATIPGQPCGTKIKYYVSAEDENGMRSLLPQEAESDIPEYYSFGIYELNTQTLELTFEEGPRIPIDGSCYENLVTMVGNPTFSTDAIDGNYCIYLEGDSSYLEVDSPFLHSNELTVDLWFAADSMIKYTRIINKPVNPDNWYQNNYQIRFQSDNKISAGSYIPASNRYLIDELTLDSTLTIGKWYHIIYEVTDSMAIIQLRDENDQFIDQKSALIFNSLVKAAAPLRIGYATGKQHYKGKIDNIKIYNYAAAGLSTRVKPEKETIISSQVELYPNYPNPFNPKTEIQFAIPQQQKVTLFIYNLLGKKVKALVNESVVAGKYIVSWDGTNEFGNQVASGIYFYELKYQDIVKVKKMLLLR